MPILVQIKRIYEPVSPQDGFRVLVDRLWPRGVKKENAAIDKWLKDVAPSVALRKWFNHEPEKWKRFAEKYAAELESSVAVTELRDMISKYKKVTLLYAAKDELHNHALALQQWLSRSKR